MASTILGALAGTCALLALLAATGATLALGIAALPPRISTAPAAGCAFAGLLWACVAIALGWLSSALAGQ